jgi:DNA-binding response OmpR family regulator
MLILNLAPEVPPEVRAWATKTYLVEEVDESIRAVELIQEAPEQYGIFLIHLERASVEGAIRACRLVRRLSDVPIVLVTEDSVRSSDRLNGLHAGANDFLSGPIGALELASRIDQAVIAGGRPAAAEPPDAPGDQKGGARLLTPLELSAEIDARVKLQGDAPFTFVRLRTAPGSRTESVIREAILLTIRIEEGDRVGELVQGTGVILQGTSLKQVGAFVKRLESRIGMDQVTFEWQGFSSAADMDQVLALLPRLSAQDQRKILMSAS